MTETQQPGRPIDAKSDEWQRDLNPNPTAGQNVGLNTAGAEKNAPTAHDIKEVHRLLNNYSDDELKRIPILPSGTRLKQGAIYINLATPECKEFTAMGGMEAGPEDFYVPKSEVDYPLWNRLIGVQDPDRLDEEGISRE